MSPGDFERLGQFFGAYFHEDWDTEAPDWAGLVKHFVEDHPETKSIAELAQLVDDYADNRDDETLDDLVLDELGCYYCPSSEGITMRDWLHRVSDLLRTYAAG